MTHESNGPQPGSGLARVVFPLTGSLAAVGLSLLMHRHLGDPRLLTVYFVLPVAVAVTAGLAARIRMYRGHAQLVAFGSLAAAAVFLFAAALLTATAPAIEPLSTLTFAPIEAAVIPGGESLSLRVPELDRTKILEAHVAFYFSDGRALVAGHSVSDIAQGAEYEATLFGDQGIKQLTVTVVGCYDDGLVIEGLPMPAREPLEIAMADQIRAGDASVRVFGRELAAQIEGVATPLDGAPRLVVTLLEDQMRPGYSGAPLVQDGRLTGVMDSYLRNNPETGFARPAAVVYARLAGESVR